MASKRRLSSLPSRLTTQPPGLTAFDTGDRGRAQASPWRQWYKTTRCVMCWLTAQASILLSQHDLSRELASSL